ncbi:MAG: DUF4019 domain-containing protein [Pseudomonadota bacterium]
MKLITKVIIVASIFLGTTAFAQDSAAVSKAQDAAKLWLALTDTGEYSRSWEQAAGLLQAAVTKEKWEAAIQSVRSPLGAVKTRTIKSATFMRTLPGAPDGEYVVIQYNSKFENKANAIETVTPMREKDGSWKVSGYFIK